MFERVVASAGYVSPNLQESWPLPCHTPTDSQLPFSNMFRVAVRTAARAGEPTSTAEGSPSGNEDMRDHERTAVRADPTLKNSETHHERTAAPTTR